VDIGKTLYVSTRKEWRAWLAKNHAKEQDIWLVYYRKGSGKPRISYDDAVEEALCYGWIDSTVKNIDDERFAQRFSPRHKNRPLSQANKERIDKLIKQKKMTPAGLAAVAGVYRPDNTADEDFVIPPDILAALKANKQAWDNFQKFPETYKRIRIAYIDSRRRHSREMFEKSLNHFVKRTAENKRIGFVHV
jgi:uncharacterized protein YdeI (YjbR/CyaY-like superfamily)